jgi:hypothetical protein
MSTHGELAAQGRMTEGEIRADGRTVAELVAAGERDPYDLYGLIPDNYICVDCKMDTWPGHKTRAETEQRLRAAGEAFRSTLRFTSETEVYYVHPHVWEASGLGGFWNGCLCIGCLEKRIGRRLQPFDFIPDQGLNDPKLPGTIRRFERLTGTEATETLGKRPKLPEPSKLDLALQSALGKRWAA